MDKPCQFCGSKTRWVERDYYDRADATEPHKDPCCLAQKRNMDFIRKRFDQRDQNIPDLDDVAEFE